MADDRRKRSRVSRACNECRKKKVKCDGQMPCIHCTVYSYECTYDQNANRRRTVDQHVRIDSRGRYAELVLASVLKDIDIYSPRFNLQGFLETLRSPQGLGHTQTLRNLARSFRSDDSEQGSVVGSLAQALANGGGPASDLAVSYNSVTAISSVSPASDDQHSVKLILPPRSVAIELIESTWDHACVLFRFYHRPSFIRDLDVLYDTDPDDFSDKQHKILPLVYSVMATGCLFLSPERAEQLGIKDADEGYRYFVAARKLVDITDAKDLYSIQSIVMMVLFLQCSSRPATTYSYIGLAMRASLRAGLHRKLPYSYNPIELETRKRLFWTVRKLDAFINSLLGLPRSIEDDEIDQDMPVELDDENITEDGYFPQQPSRISSTTISNVHTRLVDLLNKVMKTIYPVRQPARGPASKANTPGFLQFKRVEDLENRIAYWRNTTPPSLNPLSPLDQIEKPYLKANRMMAMTYCYVQIMLYRPFIHYCKPRSGQDIETEEASVARVYALRCINVSRQAVYFANELVSHGLLRGVYFFSVYTLFFAVACLVYYVHVNAAEYRELSEEVRRDIELGKTTLRSLRNSSVAAGRTYNILNQLFDKLNELAVGADVNANATEAAHIGTRVLTDEAAEAALSASGGAMLKDDELRKPDSSLFEQLMRQEQQLLHQEREILRRDQTATATPDTVDEANSTGTPVRLYHTGQINYAPGIMDQIDQQLFGRLLPPSMNQAPEPVQSQMQSESQTQPQPQPAPPPADNVAADPSLDFFLAGQGFDDFFNRGDDLSGLSFNL